MNRLLSILALTALLPACATSGLSDAQKLDLYRAHAGTPVKDFQSFGTFSGWTPLGDHALTVWTRPNRAYLLDLTGPCPDLGFAPAISLSNQMGNVSARFDYVTVHGTGGLTHIPCRIQEIRPLDVKGLKEAQRALRKADAVERERSGGGR